MTFLEKHLNIVKIGVMQQTMNGKTLLGEIQLIIIKLAYLKRSLKKVKY